MIHSHGADVYRMNSLWRDIGPVVSIGSADGLSLVRRQANALTDIGLLSVGQLEQTSVRLQLQSFCVSFVKMHWKMSPAKLPTSTKNWIQQNCGSCDILCDMIYFGCRKVHQRSEKQSSSLLVYVYKKINSILKNCAPPWMFLPLDILDEYWIMNMLALGSFRSCLDHLYMLELKLICVSKRGYWVYHALPVICFSATSFIE